MGSSEHQEKEYRDPWLVFGQNQAQQECDALMEVCNVLEDQPEPHHITYCIDTHTYTLEADGAEYMYSVTRWVTLVTAT